MKGFVKGRQVRISWHTKREFNESTYEKTNKDGTKRTGLEKIPMPFKYTRSDNIDVSVNAIVDCVIVDIATKETIVKSRACCVERDVFDRPYGRFLAFMKAIERVPKKDREHLKTQYYKQVTKTIRVPSHLARGIMLQVASFIEQEKKLTAEQVALYGSALAEG